MDKKPLEAFQHLQLAIAALEPDGDTLCLAYLHQAYEALVAVLGFTCERGSLHEGRSMQ